ncbi:ATP-dependent zinc protease [Halomonas sabkhae]|uniref:ATP-dependent zinc protease family protein n=1 Tax=Halomonas sabkhae TaxID=626223 RepID=UPI0025B59F5A|nr:ATP-dependent zinc protease [Halomonas sabkhae]MDN3526427.1 ATP-dependent zinc protease [Halomonas sabkhae]
MPKRPSLMLTLLGAAALLGGCAWLPSQQEPAPPPVTSAEFQVGLQQLERRVMAQCDDHSERLAQQRQGQRTLTADVREVGRLVRDLSTDIEQLERDSRQQNTTRVVTECRATDDRLANKELLGRTEWVGLPDIGTSLKARVDSGADTSSLSARDITPFERDGEDWVRFKLGVTKDDAVAEVARDSWQEAPIERRVRVIQAAGEESRPVIELLMTLGPIREPVQFTLTDRRDLAHPVLLGRRFLMDIAIIDVAREFVHDQPEMPGTEADSADGEEDATSDESS